MARKQDDPTVRILRGAAPEYPDGTHPPAAPSEQAWGPNRFSYSDMPVDQKPDESTVAQTLDSDPLQDDADKARQQDFADAAAKAEGEPK
jgi:hypothetical protein